MPGIAKSLKSSLRAALGVTLKFITKRQKELRSAWRREANRILRNAERVEARGYTVNYDKLNLKPPKVFSQRSVDRLHKIRGDEFYNYLTYQTDTGEVVHGVVGRRMERSKAARKAAATAKAKRKAKQEAKAAEEAAQRAREASAEAHEAAAAAQTAARAAGIGENPYPETVEPPAMPDDWSALPRWEDMVIANTKFDIGNVGKPSVADFLIGQIDRWVEAFGKEETARILQETTESGELDWDVKYDQQKAYEFVTKWTEELVARNAMDPDDAADLFAAIEADYDWRDWDYGDPLDEFYGGGY